MTYPYKVRRSNTPPLFIKELKDCVNALRCIEVGDCVEVNAYHDQWRDAVEMVNCAGVGYWLIDANEDFVCMDIWRVL